MPPTRITPGTDGSLLSKDTVVCVPPGLGNVTSINAAGSAKADLSPLQVVHDPQSVATAAPVMMSGVVTELSILNVPAKMAVGSSSGIYAVEVVVPLPKS